MFVLSKGEGKVKMWELLLPVPGPIRLWRFSCKPHRNKDDGRGSILLFQGSLLCLKDQGRLFLVEKHTFIAF